MAKIQTSIIYVSFEKICFWYTNHKLIWSVFFTSTMFTFTSGFRTITMKIIKNLFQGFSTKILQNLETHIESAKICIKASTTFKVCLSKTNMFLLFPIVLFKNQKTIVISNKLIHFSTFIYSSIEKMDRLLFGYNLTYQQQLQNHLHFHFFL